jgi:hypothetical protein
MESSFVRGLVFGLAGCIVGLSMGVAAFGDAVNGAFVFGPIGFVIGWLLPWSRPNVPIHGEGAGETPEPRPGVVRQTSDITQVEKSVNDMMPLVGRMLAAVWNMQMKALIALGLMGHFQKYPWVFVGVALLLLALVFPLGVIFSVTGLAALHFNVSARDQFLVNLEGREG